MDLYSVSISRGAYANFTVYFDDSGTALETFSSAELVLSSGSLFLLARNAIERSKKEEGETITAILLSWIAFETFFNELVEVANVDRKQKRAIPESISAFASILRDMEEQHDQLGTKNPDDVLYS